MSGARISSISANSPASDVGLLVGDVILSINGTPPTDVIEYQRMVDGETVELVVQRDGEELSRKVRISKAAGLPLGLQIESAVFDRIRTCDNHCSFCFIYQLPKGMRRSLYVKDDDYRLSFLYGNYTTLTRFTEFDLERVVNEGLSPLYVSIHTTNEVLRAEMLRNPRGATSLRWLHALLQNNIAVHGQVVLCPGVNDGEELRRTLADVLTQYPDVKSVSVVPIGVSDFSTEATMRPMTDEEARSAVLTVEEWAAISLETLGRRIFFASDELYLQAGVTPPAADEENINDLIENGVGLVSTFVQSFVDRTKMNTLGTGFFQSVDGAPAEGYRAPRTKGEIRHAHQGGKRLAVLTGEYAAPILRKVLKSEGFVDVDVIPVINRYFGGNIKVAGLMTLSDILRTIEETMQMQYRYLLPDVALSEGRFLDGGSVDELGDVVDVVETSGWKLREYLESWQVDRSSLG